MKIIDAHIHYRFGSDTYFERIAKQAGHENSPEHLKGVFDAEGIEIAIVMSNLGMSPDNMQYPDYLRYCAGIDRGSLSPEATKGAVERAELHLKRSACVGLKIYAGYTRLDLTDPLYLPYYELAQAYDKPVAVHTGITARADTLLKYSHPMQLDDVAVAFPEVQFVMCHFGNPWLNEAAAVLEKNENVYADLSGLLVGKLDMEEYLQTQRGYVEQLRTWIAYVDNYEKFMYGTDWPLANIGDYIRLTSHIIPEKHHEKVFYDNARRVFKIEC
jgi:predicted TIM-barrel fold metal-dependent hydrolase